MLLLLRKVYNLFLIILQVFFQYLVTGRLDGSCYNLILNYFIKTGTTFAVLSTEGKNTSHEREVE